MNGILKFVEYAISISPIAKVTNGTSMEPVVMFTTRTTMTKRSFPRGAHESILELYASVSICDSSDVLTPPIGSVLTGVMSDEVTDDDRTDGSLEGEEH